MNSEADLLQLYLSQSTMFSIKVCDGLVRFFVTVWRGGVGAIFYPYPSTLLSVCVSQKKYDIGNFSFLINYYFYFLYHA
jgi:hypothetical protein